MRKTIYSLIMAGTVLFSGVFGVSGTAAAATVTEVIEQKVTADTAVEITDDITLEMEDAPVQGQEPAGSGQKEERAVVSPQCKAPFYGPGCFYDAIDARWETSKIFPYNPNNVYKIYCRPGYITDLALKEGEAVTYTGAGDTLQWVIDTASVSGAPHIYIKPVREGIETNLIINTGRHSYQLLLVATDWYIPMVSWNYWLEERIACIERREREESMSEKTTVFAWKKNYSYKIKARGKKPGWLPDKVYDDGAKTVIQFNDLSKEAPVLFILDGKEKKPANYRLQNNSFVVDGVFQKAELLSGKYTVVITNKGGDKDE